MKGYKGMDANMRCRGMQYEIGKTYHVDGVIDVCKNGLHFCQNLKDVFDFYKRDGNRFFEVEASGAVKMDGNKSAASDMRIIRELADVEINKLVYGYGYVYGYDYVYGYSYGYVYDCGNGHGDGYGYGDGYGDGDGDGYGYGDGDGDGYGNGYGNDDIQKILLFV